MYLALWALLFPLFITGCSIERRHHLPGFYTEWKFRTNQSATALSDEPVKTEPAGTVTVETVSNADVTAVYTGELVETPQITVPAEDVIVAPDAASSQPDNTISGNGEVTTKQTNWSRPEISRQSMVKKTQLVRSMASSDPLMLVLAILCFFLGLSPLSVYLMAGAGSEFTLNLILELAGIACLIVGIILAFALASFIAVILYALGGLLLLAAVIHAIVVIVQNI